jgi:hypothetical protein
MECPQQAQRLLIGHPLVRANPALAVEASTVPGTGVTRVSITMLPNSETIASKKISNLVAPLERARHLHNLRCGR